MGQPPVLIRPYEPPDLQPLVRLLREVRPDRLTTEVGFRYRLTALAGKDRRRLWVALVGDELVGAASAQSVWWTQPTDTALVWAGVAASWRRLGIGSRLLDLAERHGCTIGATRLRCEVVLDDGRAFIGRRGYERGRSERVSALDPRTADLSSLPRLERSASEQGFRLAPLAAAAGLERELYDLDLAASRDIPADEEITFSLEDWRRDLWLDPEVDREASQVVLEGDRPVALAYLRVDREGRRAANEATGTARPYRRRGLATLVKLATIRWAAEHGIESIRTDNDAENIGMLAINQQLGYEPRFVREGWKRPVGEAGTPSPPARAAPGQ